MSIDTNDALDRIVPRRWRWYDGVAFYAVVQLLTFGLGGLTSAARGNTGRDAREAVFGDVSYFRALKQAVVAPPSWICRGRRC